LREDETSKGWRGLGCRNGATRTGGWSAKAERRPGEDSVDWRERLSVFSRASLEGAGGRLEQGRWGREQGPSMEVNANRESRIANSE